MRLAWFSPMPPVRSGIAACSATLVEALRRTHDIDVYVDEPVARVAPDTRSAHEFVWRQHLQPCDLTVYQLGNSSHHDYQWPYLFRYPGLLVLHDVHLHHARAAALLRNRRAADYRAEFTASHPGVNADLAELAVRGFDSHLYYLWPMTRLAISASRMTAVHTRVLADRLGAELPGSAIEFVRIGHGDPLDRVEADRSGAEFRRMHGIPADALVFGCFGGLTADKRVPQILGAFRAVLPYVPAARLLLGGAGASHYDVSADVGRHGLDPHVTMTGYLERDADLRAAVAACDVALNLRWPSAREVSGPWLQCLAAGKPTVTIDLDHLADVPSLDPRTWQVQGHGEPVRVAIDVLDEDHSLRLAMRRLATDPALRAALGRAGASYWKREHAPAVMISDYERLLPRAAALPPPRPVLPPHLEDDGGRVLRELLQGFGLTSPLR